jgi:hypothetical protein
VIPGGEFPAKPKQPASQGVFVFNLSLSKLVLNGQAKNKNPPDNSVGRVCFGFAERGGFEPPVQLPIRQFSKLLV